MSWFFSSKPKASSTTKSWILIVQWDNVGKVNFSDPNVSYGGVVEHNSTATVGSKKMTFQAATISDAMKMACDWAIKNGYKPWSCYQVTS